MFKRKRVLFFVLLAFLLGSLGYYYFLIYKKNVPNPDVKGELMLTNTFPASGKAKILLLTSGIYFSFDSPLVLSSAQVIIDPPLEIATDLAQGDPKTLIVWPKESWQFDTLYRIVIKSGLASTDNKELKQDVFYEVTFEAPDDIMSF